MIRFVIPSIWPTACLLSYASPAQYLAEIITRLCTTHTHTQRERDGLLLILVQQARTNYSKKGSRLCTQQLDANESVSLSLCAHTLEAHGRNRRDEPRVSVDFPRVRLTSQATTFRPYRSSQTPWNRPFPLCRTDPTQQNTRKRERETDRKDYIAHLAEY
uniref:Uncharacterized protein n=1 Tax=Daphnia magna TaxID=35525 RepID=A0A0P4ZHM1_9CRUS